MNLLESISDRMAVTNRPLFAITVGSGTLSRTPVILTCLARLHRRENHRSGRSRTVSYTPIRVRRCRSRALGRIDILDRARWKAGWELGAWDVARASVGCLRPGVESHEALECLQALARSLRR